MQIATPAAPLDHVGDFTLTARVLTIAALADDRART
jgi:hypothetical protein